MVWLGQNMIPKAARTFGFQTARSQKWEFSQEKIESLGMRRNGLALYHKAEMLHVVKNVRKNYGMRSSKVFRIRQ